MKKLFLISLILYLALISLAFDSIPYARKVFPVTVLSATCSENAIAYNMTDHTFNVCKNTGWVDVSSGGGGGGAPTNATYITQIANSTLTNEQALSSLSSGIMRVATTTGVVSSLTTSAGIFANISDETGGTGVLVGSISPTIISPTIAKLANLTNNGFVKTSSSDGTLSIDTSTYLTANQTITLSGNVTGSGTAAITTTIADNVVNGAMIALGSDAQGDVIYYNGTDYVRLAAGTSGQFLKTLGAGANPTWATPTGTGDVIGPGSATDNAIVRFDSTTGKLIKNSTILINDSGVVSGGLSFPAASSLTVTANSFYRDTGDGKFYVGSADGLAWHELFEAGVSLVSLISNVTGILPAENGGTENGFTKFSGPASSEKTFTLPNASSTLTITVASGAKALATSAISSGACSSAQTDTATGTATTDSISWVFNADPTSTTGYSASANGMLTIIVYPTANTVNFKVCNNTASSITPGATTLNWRVVR